MDFNKWIRQPTTIHGIAVLAGGVGAAMMHLATGNPTYDMVIGLSAYAMVHLGVDDYSATAPVAAVAQDAIDAITGKQVNAEKVLGDILSTVEMLKTPAASATTLTTTMETKS